MNASVMPETPDTASAKQLINACWRFIRFLFIYAAWAMPNEEITNPKNTNLDKSTKAGSWKKSAMSGAQQNSTP